MSDLFGKTTIVVGASRGLAHIIAKACRDIGTAVIAMARSDAAFLTSVGGGGTVQLELTDARDLASRLT